MFQPKSLSRIIFDGHDANHDGVLDIKELRMVFYDLGRHYTEEEMVFAMAKLDKDKDSSVCYKEFLEWWRKDDRFDMLVLTAEEQKFLTESVAYFKYFDKNLSGVLEEDELEELKKNLQSYGYSNVHVLNAPLKLSDYLVWLMAFRVCL